MKQVWKIILVAAFILTSATLASAEWMVGKVTSFNPRTCQYRLTTTHPTLDGAVRNSFAYPYHVFGVGGERPTLVFDINNGMLHSLFDSGVTTPQLMARVAELNVNSDTRVLQTYVVIEPLENSTGFKGTGIIRHFNAGKASQEPEFYELNSSNIVLEENCDTTKEIALILDGHASKISRNASSIASMNRIVRRNQRMLSYLLRRNLASR